MKHDAWKSLAIVVLVSSLALAGCERKKEATAPAEPAPEQKAAAPAVNMQDGEWEITMKVEMPKMPGMPAGAMKPHTVKTCLTKEDYVPKTNREQSDCKVENQKIDGNTVSWSVACKEATGTGTVTYSGDSMNGLIETATKIEGKEMKTKMIMSGKRLGPCPPK